MPECFLTLASEEFERTSPQRHGSLRRLSSTTINDIFFNNFQVYRRHPAAMYPAQDEELENEQCLPLTGVNCAEIDEALRSLSASASESSGRTFEETRKLLKQVRHDACRSDRNTILFPMRYR